jgi:hypothetical protein
VTLALLQAHLRGEHRSKAREECPACVRAGDPDEVTEVPKTDRVVPLQGRECECGCGAAVRARFLPGHDARLKSQLVREARAGDIEAKLRLERLGWLRFL